MIDSTVHVAILEDHQSIVDGYLYRLDGVQSIRVVGTAVTGEQLLPLLSSIRVDVLLMDINVPTSKENKNIFPVMHIIPKILREYPQLRILVISMLTQKTLIDALIDAGVAGYIYKNDQSSIQQLARIVGMIVNGGMYFSQGAYLRNGGKNNTTINSFLTLRQLEILSICAAYPDVTTAELALRLGIASSTLRNLLSSAYLRLDVRTRAAAIAKAQQMGLLAGSIFSDTSSSDVQ